MHGETVKFTNQVNLLIYLSVEHICDVVSKDHRYQKGRQTGMVFKVPFRTAQ